MLKHADVLLGSTMGLVSGAALASQSAVALAAQSAADPSLPPLPPGAPSWALWAQYGAALFLTLAPVIVKLVVEAARGKKKPK